MSDYRVENVEERAKEHPATFRIHSRTAREQVRVRDYVKLILLLDPAPAPTTSRQRPAGERPWVEVMSVANGRYVGKIVNDPVVVAAKIGDVIEFGPEHIADLQIRMALARSVPSRTHPGYTHPSGRHVTLVTGQSGVAIVDVRVPVKKASWEERLKIPFEALCSITADDPLDLQTN
jgi:hypothetical protein